MPETKATSDTQNLGQMLNMHTSKYKFGRVVVETEMPKAHKIQRAPPCLLFLWNTQMYAF